MRSLYHPEVGDIALSTVFYALSDPVRLEILRQLAEKEEISCGGIQIDLPKSTMSHHFKVLRESGVIRTRLEGTQRFIVLRTADLESRFPGLLGSVLNSIQGKRNKKDSTAPRTQTVSLAKK